MKNFFCIIFFLLTARITALSQNTDECPLSLQDYQQLYSQGQLNDIPTSLEKCLENARTSFPIKEERIAARKLLTLVYIYLDDTKNASRAMVRLLKEDPEHEPDQTDPAEFIYLYNRFSSDPFASISFKAGNNFTDVNQVNAFDVDNGEGIDPYSSGTGIYAGLTVEYRFLKDLDVGAGLIYSARSFDYERGLNTTTLANRANLADETRVFNFSTLEYRETNQSLDIPIFLKYTYSKSLRTKLKPYGFIGFTTSLLINSEQEELVRGIDEGVEAIPSDSPPIDITSNRETLNFSAFGGIGAKYKVLRIHYVFIEAQYSLGLTNYVDTESRFGDLNGDRINRLLDLDDDFKLNDLTVSFGFSFSIFRTKSLVEKSEKKKDK